MTNKIKVVKGSYNRHLIEKNNGDPNAFWKTVKKILPGERNKDFVQAKQRPPFEFKEVSEASIRYQLRCLKSNKAVGLDDIPPRLLKDAAQIVAQPLTNIINVSLIKTGQGAHRVEIGSCYSTV